MEKFNEKFMVDMEKTLGKEYLPKDYRVKVKEAFEMDKTALAVNLVFRQYQLLKQNGVKKYDLVEIQKEKKEILNGGKPEVKTYKLIVNDLEQKENLGFNKLHDEQEKNIKPYIACDSVLELLKVKGKNKIIKYKNHRLRNINYEIDIANLDHHQDIGPIKRKLPGKVSGKYTINYFDFDTTIKSEVVSKLDIKDFTFEEKGDHTNGQ